MLFISFSCLIALAKTLHTVLNRIAFREKETRLSLLKKLLAVLIIYVIYDTEKHSFDTKFVNHF